jgi:putative acetyltransferase
MNDAIQPIRRAARQLVRELHLLDGRVECCNLPLSQCHLIIELNMLGEATASDLSERLVLEKSTMSRLVNTLVEKGLVCAACCQDDRRARILCLTDAGKAQAQRLEQHARSQVESALEFVSPRDERLVVEGLERYARSLRYARQASCYQIRPIRQEDNAAVAAIIREVMTEFGAVGENYSISDPEVDAMHESYPAPNSAFFVVESDDGILGCGGMGPLEGAEADVCELRKMYFLPDLRGTGMGSKLLRRILHSARQAGYRRCYLETIKAMKQARSLYRGFGFTSLDRPLGNTGHSGCNQHMILKL